MPDRNAPQAVSSLPASYAEAQLAGEYRSARWWVTYEDPVLDRLVQTALDNNLEIGEAIARVEEVRARYVRERADQFPQLNAGLQANYSDRPATGIGAALGGQGPDGADMPDGDGQPGGGMQPPTDEPSERFAFSTFTAQLELSYEADLWGRLRSQSRAALQNYEASLWDLETVRLSIASETMRNYFDVIEAAQLRDISAEQADILRERVSLTEQAFLRGLSPSFELITLRENLREAEAVVPRLEASLLASKTRLAVLIGTYPDELNDYLLLAEPLEVFLALDPVPPGLPAQLLVQRPDVRAALERLGGARFGVAAARAARLPRLSLNATGGFESGDVAGLFDPQNWFVNLLGALTAPIFDGGQFDANVDIGEAQRRQRAMAYGQAVLTAYAEVEEALRGHRAATDRVRLLANDLETAREAADLQLRRFERGTGAYADYLDSRLNVLNSRRSLVGAERELAGARLAVHRALGGAWMPEGVSDDG